MTEELSRILRPLACSCPTTSRTHDFVLQLKRITLQANESIVSYDVSALFTSVPINPAINIIKRRLELDQELHLKTSKTVVQIISLLEFSLKTTYFQFQGRFFEQLQGAAMGSPISPIVANLYMENFENKAINTAECPPKFLEEVCGWHFCGHRCYKEARFPVAHQQCRPHIHFTTEDATTVGSIPFLDTIVIPQSGNSLLTSVYRKHTDMYMHWNSHHHLLAKFSVINTLKHRAMTVCSNNHLLNEEEDHLNKVLKTCNYPEWALTRANIKQKRKTNTNQGTINNTNKTSSNNKPYIVVP